MVQHIDVAVFVGSLRKASINRMLANALIELAPADLKLSIIEIGQLPFYNQDREENPPPQWIQLREQIKAATAVLFVTAEYNRSVPAALKNALDVGSRPYGMNAWSSKPGAVVSASPGAIGGFGEIPGVQWQAPVTGGNQHFTNVALHFRHFDPSRSLAHFPEDPLKSNGYRLFQRENFGLKAHNLPRAGRFVALAVF